ncbi:MAG: YccF domain-containing protein [candidate division KSB1 bacterium]|nr:YccF domain-containing protein [candidate division KSB1 bacterium]
MSLLGNILWILVGGGIVLFFEYLIGGVLLCLTIIGIPFGIQCIKLSAFALLPFGRDVQMLRSRNGCLSVMMNVLWILLGGLWIAITHIVFGLFWAITIIGLPFAKQHLKLAALALTPFGYEVK